MAKRPGVSNTRRKCRAPDQGSGLGGPGACRLLLAKPFAQCGGYQPAREYEVPDVRDVASVTFVTTEQAGSHPASHPMIGRFGGRDRAELCSVKLTVG